MMTCVRTSRETPMHSHWKASIAHTTWHVWVIHTLNGLFEVCSALPSEVGENLEPCMEERHIDNAEQAACTVDRYITMGNV